MEKAVIALILAIIVIVGLNQINERSNQTVMRDQNGALLVLGKEMQGFTENQSGVQSTLNDVVGGLEALNEGLGEVRTEVKNNTDEIRGLDQRLSVVEGQVSKPAQINLTVPTPAPQTLQCIFTNADKTSYIADCPAGFVTTP